VLGARSYTDFCITMSPGKRRKPKRLLASKEVKRRARITLGSPPPSRKEESRRKKLPKHKKRELEKELT
jgi:hypothetical protein